MVIVELLGSLSLAVALVSVVAFVILHMKNRSTDIIYVPDRSFNPTVFLSRDVPKLVTDTELPILDVINDEEVSVSPVKYGIQWQIAEKEDDHSEEMRSSAIVLKASEFEQGDTVLSSDQSTSVRNLIEKFENNSKQKTESHQTMSELTSVATNFDHQTIRTTDFNGDQPKLSHHSSISNLDVTIPSNLSSSMDLEQFECFSTTSDLSEILINN